MKGPFCVIVIAIILFGTTNGKLLVQVTRTCKSQIVKVLNISFTATDLDFLSPDVFLFF